jgi:tRNA (guanine-N7-)-methyltransferase
MYDGNADEGASRPRALRPYADAPRLPEGEHVDARGLVQGTEYELEIGPGRGGFLFERAKVAPGAALLGVEVRRKWAEIVDHRLAKHGLAKRARVFAEDAKDALPRLGPDAIFARVFVHFPDPWWKKRHAKRILMDAPLLAEIARLLVFGGELFVQTDVAERADQYEELVKSDARFAPSGDDDGTARLADNPYGARSPRERRAQQDGLPVHRLRYRRT